MTRLDCPFCGPRELGEFEYRKTLPNAGQTNFEQVYERIDSLVESREHWQHLHGCRAWLEIHRNPSTGTVLLTRLLGQVSS